MKPGTLIGGKYRLRRPLGDGAMGVVWAAVNELVDSEVALKLLQSKNPELRRRLLREAKACGRLSHPNIVKVYDVGETSEGDPFLVMELLKGETLSERLHRERSLPPAVAVGITIDVARALRVAHEAGVIHRDLKPANIFLYRESDDDPGSATKLKVLDFGVSKLALENESTATVSGTLLGSPAYMSPEQAQALPIDGRADLWSLGVVLFEMLTGVRPFQSRSMTGVLAELLNKPIPRVESVAPAIDPRLSEVVSRCIERNLDLRVKNADELIARLRPFAGPRDDHYGSWEGPPPSSVGSRSGSAPQYALSTDPLTVMTTNAEEDSEDEYEPTSLYEKPEDAGFFDDPVPIRGTTESQRPTLELPKRTSAPTMPPLPPLSVPRIFEFGAPPGAFDRSEEETALLHTSGTPVPPSSLAEPRAPIRLPVGTTSTLSTTPVSHAAPAGLRPESIPPAFRRWKVDGMAPLIAVGASLGLAIAAVVVFTTSGAQDTSDSAPAASITAPLPASSSPPVAEPPPAVAESAAPVPSASASAAPSARAPSAPAQPSPLRGPLPGQPNRKPLPPRGR
jgi:serine/threonine protein kinase